MWGNHGASPTHSQTSNTLLFIATVVVWIVSFLAVRAVVPNRGVVVLAAFVNGAIVVSLFISLSKRLYGGPADA